MTRLLITSIFIAIGFTCQSQDSKEQSFGTKNIDHKSIALDFMENIKAEEYKSSYNLLSKEYQDNFNLEDFTFKMRMLNNLASNDDFYHYRTTFIGQTPKEEIAKLNGEKVTQNIMPEYDFTLQNQADSSFKSVKIFLRFENENSEKISVINYAKHILINEETGMSSVSANLFFVGKYILVVEKGNRLLLDVRGGDLREMVTTLPNYAKNKTLVNVEFSTFEEFLSQNDISQFSLIHIKEKGDSDFSKELMKVAEAHGLSVFNYRYKEYRNITVSNIDSFITKYTEGNWNPINNY